MSRIPSSSVPSNWIKILQNALSVCMNWSRLHTAEPCMRHWENSQRSSKASNENLQIQFFFFQIRRATNRELNRWILLAKKRRLLSTTRDSCVIRFESIWEQHYRHDFLVIRHCARHCARERVRCLPKIDNVKISRCLSLSVRINVHVYLFERNGTREVPRIKSTSEVAKLTERQRLRKNDCNGLLRA